MLFGQIGKEGKVDILDVGCGFGGLTIELATLFPDKITMALEIRPKVNQPVGIGCHLLLARSLSASGSSFCFSARWVEWRSIV